MVFITNGTEANAYIFSVSPTQSFVDGAPAVVVRTSAPTQYVRVFTAGVTNPVGGFIAPPNTIRGLTVEQVRDVLALPFLPTSLTVVEVPAGTVSCTARRRPSLATLRPSLRPFLRPVRGAAAASCKGS